MNKMLAVTIREVLEQKGEFFGWLFLPSKPWTLDTNGLFIQEDKDSDPSEPFPPIIVEPCRLSAVLDWASIEDIVLNAKEQVGRPSVDNLFKAFIFYIENDAFITF